MDAVLTPMIDSVVNVGLAHLIRKMTANYTDTDGLQAPFSLAVSKAAVESFKRMQRGDERAADPLMNVLSSVVFADTTIQNVTEVRRRRGWREGGGRGVVGAKSMARARRRFKGASVAFTTSSSSPTRHT
jgi:hypothetical protein